VCNVRSVMCALLGVLCVQCKECYVCNVRSVMCAMLGVLCVQC